MNSSHSNPFSVRLSQRPHFKQTIILLLRAITCCLLLVLIQQPFLSGRVHASRLSIVPSESGANAVILRLIEADNSRNLRAVLNSYTNDITFFPPTGEVVVGKAAVRQRYRKLFSKFQPCLTCKITDATVRDSFGCVCGVNQGRLTPIAGGPSTPINDNFIAVLRYNGKTGWRVSKLMWIKCAE